MSRDLSRRDFLKIVGGSAVATTLSRPFAARGEMPSATRPNIIMVYAGRRYVHTFLHHHLHLHTKSLLSADRTVRQPKS